VPMRGWYEWSKQGGQKVPFLLERSDHAVLLAAGIYEDAVDVASGEVTRTFAILTCDASGPAAEVHHRMPVLMNDATARRWLDSDPADSPGLLDALQHGMHMPIVNRAVSVRVGNVRNDDPTLLEATDRPPSQESLF
jgi:putative SOS response-associated peptidase YedK